MQIIVKFLTALLNFVPLVLEWWGERRAQAKTQAKAEAAAARAAAVRAAPAHEWLRGFNPPYSADRAADPLSDEANALEPGRDPGRRDSNG